MQTNQIIRQIIRSWEVQNNAITDLFTKYDDAYYFNEVALGRNRAIYLFGHLIAMNDGIRPMFGLGDRLFPALEAIFITSPDKAVADIPDIPTLREYWQTLNKSLAEAFAKMGDDQWLEKHTRVPEADFALDPMRNKLNVLIGRINHESYHAGQLAFLKPWG